MLSKGLKRKREEEETMEALSVDSCWLDPSHPAVAQTPPTVASSSLFDLSVVKLHHSLRQSEPDLRHLVLVVNTLRRIQASMEPAPVLPPEPIQPPAPSVADSLLASSDAGLSASMASLLEDLNHIEDIDTSMYDSELWLPASEGLKPGPENGPAKEEPPELDEAELDYLMDVLVGTQALERPPGPGR